MSDQGSPERAFESIASRSTRKLLGQFFTPEPLAEAMATWVKQANGRRFLDPALGTGILLDRLGKHKRDLELTGVEIDPLALDFARGRLPKGTLLIEGDYLSTVFQDKFHGIIANPPYIRHHDFTAKSNHYKSGSFGSLSRLTNIYILFLAKIISDLEERGRAAVLIPSDWTSANFGLPFKTWLQNSGYLRRLILFDTAGEVFHDNLSTGSLLLLEKTPKVETLSEIVSVPANLPASLVTTLGNATISPELQVDTREVDLRHLSPNSKWLQVLKTGVAETPNNYMEVREFATSKRGIATGANDFFHISKSDYLSKTPKSKYRECVGRARDVRGVIFTREDFEILEKSSSPTRLLDLDSSTDSSYLESGSAQGLPARYLLKNRKVWYTLETRTPADIWVGVFSREGVKFIFNEAKVHNLTCFHGLYTGLSAIENKALVALMNTSKVQHINTRQHRSYGSGLTKLEPKDLLDLALPNIASLSPEVVIELSSSLTSADKALRNERMEWRGILDATTERLDA